jgi:hypothetical protein
LHIARRGWVSLPKFILHIGTPIAIGKVYLPFAL